MGEVDEGGGGDRGDGDGTEVGDGAETGKHAEADGFQGGGSVNAFIEKEGG